MVERYRATEDAQDMQSAREKYRIEHASRKTLQVLVEGQQHFGEIMQA